MHSQHTIVWAFLSFYCSYINWIHNGNINISKNYRLSFCSDEVSSTALLLCKLCHFWLTYRTCLKTVFLFSVHMCNKIDSFLLLHTKQYLKNSCVYVCLHITGADETVENIFKSQRFFSNLIFYCTFVLCIL